MDTDQARASFASLESGDRYLPLVTWKLRYIIIPCTSQQTDNKHVRLDSVALVAVSPRDRQHHSP